MSSIYLSYSGQGFEYSLNFDRYENGDPLIRFTEAQLAEIRKATVSKLICDNSDGIDTTQRSAFDQSEPFL